MPLKISAGLSKKVGRPNYGSLGASCHLELEWDSSLLEGDAEAFLQRVRQLLAACRRAVDAELGIHAERQSGRSVDLAEPAKQETHCGASAAPIAEECQPASASQLDYARRLASRIGRAAALRVEVLAQRRYGKPLTELSRDEASRLILTLRAVKSGELDLETLLEESAA